MSEFEKAFTPKEVSVTFRIGDSTLRKWAIALEKSGYKFIRNDQNSRLFVESDLVMLRHFQQLVKQHNMQLESAANIVVDRFKNAAFEVSTGVVPVEKEDEGRDLLRSYGEHLGKMESMGEQIGQLLEHIQKQEEYNRELLHRLDQQQKYIEDKLDKLETRQNERDSILLESLRTSQETKQMLLEVKTAEEQKKPKKGLLSFFMKE